MEIHRLRKTEGGAPGWFSGKAYLEVLVPARPEGESLFLVRSAPRGHTAWHTHPQGQVLYVAEGVGLASRGERAQLLLPGDVVVFAPGEEHWHGALPDRFMAHLALQKADGEGKTAYWGKRWRRRPTWRRPGRPSRPPHFFRIPPTIALPPRSVLY